jgi:hypothetical protein
MRGHEALSQPAAAKATSKNLAARGEESDHMEDDGTYTSYCGLYCRDCIPSNRQLFSLAGELEGKLAELHFEEYAMLKARGDAVFDDYQSFLRVLQAIQGLECKAPCRAGGGKTSCEVRNCVLAHQLPGCWECQQQITCELLNPLKRFHPNLEYHLDLIRQEGIDAWSAGRKGHYSWQ